MTGGKIEKITEKDDFTTFLKRHGYNAFMENGCVMVIGEQRSIWKVVQKLAKEVGFDRSFGWRPTEKRPGESNDLHKTEMVK